MRSVIAGFLFAFLFGAPQAEKAVIEGVVRTTGTNIPVAGAQVYASSSGGGASVTATTNAEGRFTLTVNAGEYRVAATRQGFVAKEYGQRSPFGLGTVIAVAAGQRYANAVFELMPTGTVTGRVFDPEGHVMEGVSVSLSQLTWSPGGQRSLRPPVLGRQSSTTNDLGEYRLYWIPPGDYYLSARDSSGGLVSGAMTGFPQKYSTTYYPGVPEFNQAGLITVPPGNEVGGLNIILSRVKTTRVRGRVVSPVADVADSVTLVDMFSEDDRMMVDRISVSLEDRSKTFTAVSVPPGRYHLVAALRIPNRFNLSGETVIDVGEEPVENAVISVVPSKTITGQIEMAEAQTSPAVREALDKNELHVLLTPDLGNNTAFLATSAQVGRDGKFEMKDVGVVHYRASILGMPPDAYIESARMGGSDILQKGFTLNGDPPGPLQFTVSGLGGRITGVVRTPENKIVSTARVVLVPEPDRRDRSDLFKIADTDQYGRFNMQGITPGRYKIFAWEDAPVGAYYDPDFLQPYEAQAKPVNVEKNDYIQAEITLTGRTAKRVQLSAR